MADDLELLRLWRQGDSAAGEELFARHFEGVYRFFCNKAALAVDDLVQATFLACLEGRDRFEHRATFRTFLFAIARNKLRQHYEGRGDFGLTEHTTASSVIDTGVSAADLLVERAEMRLLLRALRCVPLELQILLELSYWEGLTDVELSDVVGVPVGTVKSRLRKGRQQVERQLRRLAQTPHLHRSTADNFERWTEALGRLGPPRGDPASLKVARRNTPR